MNDFSSWQAPAPGESENNRICFFSDGFPSWKAEP